MRPNPRSVYAAVMSRRSQPVRVVESRRRWSFDRTNGGLVLAGHHVPRRPDVPAFLGWLAITRGPASERYPSTEQGYAELATALRSFKMPELREKYQEAEADVRVLGTLLYEQDLGFALVRDHEDFRYKWRTFS